MFQDNFNESFKAKDWKETATFNSLLFTGAVLGGLAALRFLTKWLKGNTEEMTKINKINKDKTWIKNFKNPTLYDDICFEYAPKLLKIYFF